MVKQGWVFALLGWIAVALPSVAQTPQRLSLNEAIRHAQESSLLNKSAKAHSAGANARLNGAKTLANPTLQITPHIGENTGGLDEDILVSQTIELGDKRRQKTHSARAERDAALAQQSQAALDVTYTVQSAYYDCLLSEVEVEQAKEALNTANTFFTAAQAQFQAGDVAQSHLIRSRVEVNRATQALVTAEAEHTNHYDTLKSLLALPETAKLALTDTLTFAQVTYSLPTLLSLALKERPELRSAQHLREAREADLHASRAASQPDLLIEARRRTLDPAGDGGSIRFGILFPLLDFGKSRAESQSAKSALQEQEALSQETLRTIQLEVRKAYRALEQAQKTVLSFQAGRLESAKKLLEMAQIGYEKGATSYLERIDAQQVYRSEQVEYARALATFHAAKATLQRAVGGKLP